jgi:xanthine dehydrogenase accessory factor
MGSRRTQARRREWLLSHGLTENELEPLHAPAGLDIGADAPPEIALSILAEVVATIRGAAGQGSLQDRPGPIHPGLSAGEATCPAG